MGLLGVDDDLADGAARHVVAVLVDQVDVIDRRRLAHRARLGGGAHEVRDLHDRLGLAVGLHQAQAGELVPAVVDLGVERLARRRGIVQGGQVVSLHPLLDEKAVDGRRCAEGGDLVFFHHVQQVVGDELVKVVDEDRRRGEPLPIELAPDRLHPACLGDGQVQIVRVDVVPVAGGDDVRHRVGVVVDDHLGHARRAGGEVEEQRVVPGGLDPLEVPVVLFELLRIGEPALPPAADDKLGVDPVILPARLVDILGDVALARADAGGDASRLEAVNEVVGGQQVGGGHADRAELVEREDGEPELIVPFQHQQDHVALFDAVVGEHLGAFVGIELHLAEGEHPLLPRHVAPDHGAAVRLEAGDLVHHVVGKVEVIGDHRLKVVEHAVFVKALLAEALIKILEIHQSFSPLSFSSFMTTARNTQSSPPVAIMPCAWPES